jgi:hypothetical protein
MLGMEKCIQSYSQLASMVFHTMAFINNHVLPANLKKAKLKKKMQILGVKNSILNFQVSKICINLKIQQKVNCLTGSPCQEHFFLA